MQAIEFPYGKGLVTLNLDLETPAEVLMPELVPGVPDEKAAIRDAVSRPIGSAQLRELAKGKTSVAIVVNDITRPSPTETMLTVIVEELEKAGIQQANITVLVATGNHFLPNEEELQTIMGRRRSKL